MLRMSTATRAIQTMGIMRTLEVTRLKSATSTRSPRPRRSSDICSVYGNRLARHAWKPLPALRKRARCPASCPRLALEEAGEAAPDELVGQALLARAGGAGGAQRRRVRRADVRGVEAGSAHGGGEVLAQPAAHVPEVEAVVPAVQAVRQRPVEPLQALLGKGRRDRCRAGAPPARRARCAGTPGHASRSRPCRRARRSPARRAASRPRGRRRGARPSSWGRTRRRPSSSGKTSPVMAPAAVARSVWPALAQCTRRRPGTSGGTG